MPQRARPRANAFVSFSVLDRIPKHVDAGRPFAVRRREPVGKPVEFARLLERRIDEHQAAPFLGRNVGSERRPAVDRNGLGLAVAAEMRRKRTRSDGLEFAGEQTVLRPQQRARERRRAGIESSAQRRN